MSTAVLPIILFGCAAASMIMAQVEFARLRREIANKRPDLSDWIYGYGWHAAKYQKLFSIYRSEFPGSRRVAHAWLWLIAFMVFAISGFKLLSSSLN